MEVSMTANVAYTILLCRVLGLTLTVMMMGLLLNRQHFEAMAESLLNTPAAHMPAALVPLLVGSFILVTHNDFGFAHSAILVTLFGCFCFATGFTRAVFPDFWMSRVKACKDFSKMRNFFMGMLALGVVFLYSGFLG